MSKRKRKGDEEWEETLERNKKELKVNDEILAVNARANAECLDWIQCAEDRASVELEKTKQPTYPFLTPNTDLDKHIIFAHLKITPTIDFYWTLNDFWEIMRKCEEVDELKGVVLGPKPAGGFSWPKRRRNEWEVRFQYGCNLVLPKLEMDHKDWAIEFPKHKEFQTNLMTGSELRTASIHCEIIGPVKKRQLIRFCKIVESFGHSVACAQFNRDHILALSYRDINTFLRNQIGINLDVMKIIFDYAQLIWMPLGLSS